MQFSSAKLNYFFDWMSTCPLFGPMEAERFICTSKRVPHALKNDGRNTSILHIFLMTFRLIPNSSSLAELFSRRRMRIPFQTLLLIFLIGSISNTTGSNMIDIKGRGNGFSKQATTWMCLSSVVITGQSVLGGVQHPTANATFGASVMV